VCLYVALQISNSLRNIINLSSSNVLHACGSKSYLTGETLITLEVDTSPQQSSHCFLVRYSGVAAVASGVMAFGGGSGGEDAGLCVGLCVVASGSQRYGSGSCVGPAGRAVLDGVNCQKDGVCHRRRRRWCGCDVWRCFHDHRLREEMAVEGVVPLAGGLLVVADS
jgi:hypothetical protein